VIPTARGIDHVGYTVPDLDAAIAFFTDVLGFAPEYRAGPYADPSGDVMHDYLGVDRRARADVAVLRAEPGVLVELVQFTAPGQDTRPPLPSDAGGRHLAIGVADLDAAVAFLAARDDVELLPGENPPPDPAGPEAGLRSRYFRSPWGLFCEVIQR